MIHVKTIITTNFLDYEIELGLNHLDHVLPIIERFGVTTIQDAYTVPTPTPLAMPVIANLANTLKSALFSTLRSYYPEIDPKKYHLLDIVYQYHYQSGSAIMFLNALPKPADINSMLYLVNMH